MVSKSKLDGPLLSLIASHSLNLPTPSLSLGHLSLNLPFFPSPPSIQFNLLGWHGKYAFMSARHPQG